MFLKYKGQGFEIYGPGEQGSKFVMIVLLVKHYLRSSGLYAGGVRMNPLILAT